MPGIEPPRVLVSSQPCRGASHRTSDGFGGICSVRAPLSSAGTHRRGCRHAWLLLPEGEPSSCCRAAACSPLDPGEAGAGRKGLENHFGAGMWWEGQKKPPEHHGSGPLVNAWCRLCCPLQNVVRHWDLLGSRRCGREHFPTGVFPTSSSSLPGGGFELGMLFGFASVEAEAKGHPLPSAWGWGLEDRDPLAVGRRHARCWVHTRPWSCRQPTREGQPKVTEPLRIHSIEDI